MAGNLQEDRSSVTSSPHQLFSWMSLSPGLGSPFPWLRDLQPEERGLCLIQLLHACANQVAAGSVENANIGLGHISHLASPEGDTMQRIAAYFTEALADRMLKIWPGLYNALNSTKTRSASEEILVQKLFFELCPFLKLSYVITNQAIVEAMEGEKMIHIIDLNASEPAQWIELLRTLSARPEGPPHLRITGIHEQKEVLDQMGVRLVEEAEKLDIPFQFNSIVSTLETLDLERLRVKTGEALAVSSVLQLHKSPLCNRKKDLTQSTASKTTMAMLTRSAMFCLSKASQQSAGTLFHGGPSAWPKYARVSFSSSASKSTYNQGWNAADHNKDSDNFADKANQKAEQAKNKSDDLTDKARERAEEMKESGKEYAHETKESAKHATRAPSEKVKEGVYKAGEATDSTKEQAKDYAYETKEKAKETGEKAADKAHEAKETVKDYAYDAKEKAKETGEKAADKAKETAERTKDAAGSATEKAKEAVKGAWEAAKDTTNKIKETVVGKDDKDDDLTSSGTSSDEDDDRKGWKTMDADVADLRRRAGGGGKDGKKY